MTNWIRKSILRDVRPKVCHMVVSDHWRTMENSCSVWERGTPSLLHQYVLCYTNQPSIWTQLNTPVDVQIYSFFERRWRNGEGERGLKNKSWGRVNQRGENEPMGLIREKRSRVHPVSINLHRSWFHSNERESEGWVSRRRSRQIRTIGPTPLLSPGGVGLSHT